jgi:putative FmdB family regulatory protein
MPLYQYDCLNCGEHDEQLHKWEEEGYPKPCPHCGGTEMKRVPGIPQTPKINGSRPDQKWGYNKTTFETNIGGDGRRWTEQYDHRKRESQIKEAKKKAEKKGATIAVTRPSNSKSK